MSKIEVDAIDKQSGSTLTLGGSGTAVTLACGATQSGFGRNGSVNWQTSIKTATFTAASGEGYFCNTSGGAFTVNLPSSPSVGDIIAIKDYGSSFAAENLTIGRGGSNLNGSAVDSVRNTDNESLTLVYADATKGWIPVEEGTGFVGESFVVATGGTVTCSGNCKIHTFTGPGTFSVSALAACATNNTVSYAVIAGGGGGGANHGGGGGAGGYREVKAPSTPFTTSPLDGYSTPGNRVTVTAADFPITVGGGGARAVDGNPTHLGTQGSTSTFSTISSAGGGGGAGEQNGQPSQAAGGSGGSGGGGSSVAGPSPVPTGAAGTGNTPPVSPAQGTNGGTGFSDQTSYRDGGGGGGAATAGQGSSGAPTQANPGGAGATSSINGTPTARAGGGGGGRSTSPAGSGGSGGGGDGSFNSGGDASAASANTGGGGGGAGASLNGGAGGSGIIIIRYKFK